MWRTHGTRGEHSPFHIEPECGQVTEDIVKSGSKEADDVLQDDVSWS
jgi:hypothetical protein